MASDTSVKYSVISPSRANTYKSTYRRDKFAYGLNRRKSSKSVLVSILSIVVAMLLALFITMIVYSDGSLFYKVIEQIFTAPFKGSNWKDTISSLAIFATAALSFIFAQKVGLFNIGISGQMLFGAQVATMLSWYMTGMPNGLGQVVAILIAMLVGGCVALLVGILKVYLNINEVITCIMFNWIVYYAGSYMLNTVGTSMGMINGAGTATLPIGTNFQLAIQGTGTAAGSWIPLLVITLLIVFATFVVLNLSSFGKKTSCVGLNNNASRYAGINVQNKQLVAMLISGCLAGLLGALLYMGKQTTILTSISAKAIPQEGFNGISVGLIAMCNPAGVLPISFFFGMIYQAKASMAEVLVIDSTIADLMFGIIVYGAAILSVFYYFAPYMWFKRLKYGKKGTQHYRTYVEKLEQSNNQTSGDIHFIKGLKKRQIQMKIAEREIARYKARNEQYFTKDDTNEFIQECDQLLAKYTNETGHVIKINHRKFRMAVHQAGRNYLRLQKTYLKIFKYAKMKFKYNLIVNGFNNDLSSWYCKRLFARYNISRPQELLDKKRLNDIILNIKRYYYLNKKILVNNFFFNVRSDQEKQFENKHKTFFIDNQSSLIAHQINNINVSSYEDYLNFFDQAIGYDLTSDMTFVDLTNTKNNMIRGKNCLTLPITDAHGYYRNGLWTIDSDYQENLNISIYHKILTPLKNQKLVVQTSHNHGGDQYSLVAKKSRYILYCSNKANDKYNLRNNGVMAKYRKKGLDELSEICCHKQNYVLQMAWISKETECIAHMMQNYQHFLVINHQESTERSL